MNKLSNKLSAIAVSLVMGAIILSFVLTGFNGFNNTTGQVATVGDSPITTGEFNRALQANIDRYTQMFKGKALTSKQIQQFRLKETTLQTLISQKHMLNFANDLSFDAGKKYIKNEIKEYKMFQTGGKFNITRYKQLLKANKLSPTKFEGQIIEQIKSKKFAQMITSLQDSKAFTQEVSVLKNKKMKAIIVSFDKEEMTKNLKVEKKNITAFVKDEKNKTLLESLYKTYQAEFKEKSPKKKALTLKKVQKELAKKHLQKTDRKGLTAFNEKLTKEIKEYLEQNNTKKLKSLAKKYGISFEKEYEISLFNLNYKGSQFDAKQIHPLFKTSNTESVIEANSPMATTLLKAKSYEDKKVVDKDLIKAVEFSGQKNARQMQDEVLAHQANTSTVKMSVNL